MPRTSPRLISASAAFARIPAVLLLVLLMAAALPAAACERHLSGHQNGIETQGEASNR